MLATVRAIIGVLLKSVYLSLCEVKVQKVTVVEFVMYHRSADVLK